MRSKFNELPRASKNIVVGACARAMSLYRWLNYRERSHSPFVPVASDATTSAANKQVEQEMASTCTTKRGKRGSYTHYSEETRAKIARYAAEHGNKAAISKFSVELGKPLAESTVRNMKKAYYKLCEEPNPNKITSLPRADRGRPLMLKGYDQEVALYIKSLHIAGGIVNRSIVIAAARGIVSHRNPGLLKEHGGSIDLGRKWAESFLYCHGYVKRKATKAARKLPPDFPDVKLGFLKESKMKWSLTPYH